MTRQRRSLLIASLIGAAIGARIAGHGIRLPADLFDKTLAAHWEFMAAGVGWVVFSLYWELTASGASAAKRSESRSSRRVHVFLTNAALLLEFAPIHGLGRFAPMNSAIMMAGIAVELMGLCLTLWARRCLGRHWSGEITIKVDHELVRTGPYARIRHPIYTGLLAMYAGTALVTGTWLAAIGLAMAVYAYWRKIRLEEANLDTAFGADYDAYRRETWALVPGLF